MTSDIFPENFFYFQPKPADPLFITLPLLFLHMCFVLDFSPHFDMHREGLYHIPLLLSDGSCGCPASNRRPALRPPLRLLIMLTPKDPVLSSVARFPV